MSAVGAPFVTSVRASAANAGAALPLTGAQEGVWLAQALDPTSPVFNTADAVDLEGDLDSAALARAIRTVLEGAGALHVRFEEGPGGPVQRPSDRRDDWTLAILDLRGGPDPAGAADAWMAADLMRPVDLATDRLFATALLRTGDRAWTWYLRIHHIATDAYATALLMRRVAERMRAPHGAADGATVDLAPLETLIDADVAFRAGPQRDLDRAFWQDRFRGRTQAPASLAGRTAAARPAPVRARHRLGAATAGGLDREAARAEAGWPELLMAGLAINLASLTGANEQTLAMPVLARAAAIRKASGIAVNLIPVAVDAAPDRTLAAITRSIRDELRAARPHQGLRFEEMARLTPAGTAPLFGPQVNIKPFSATLTFGAATGRVRNLATGPVDDLALFATPDPSGAIDLALDGNPSLYGQAEVDDALARIAHTLAACTENGALDRPAGALPTITPTERRTVVGRFNDTTHAVPRATLVDLLRAQLSRTPDAPALTDGGGTITFVELHRRAERLATELRGLGAGPGAIVALGLERSAALSVGVLGVLLAGAAFLPIDPGLPEERRTVMTRTAGPVCVVTAPGSGLAWSVPQVALDRAGHLAAPAAAPSREQAARDPAPTDPAYVIFTSGSTGQPKGVLTEHAAIVNRLAWMQHHLPIGPGDAVLQKTPCGFDVSVWELLWPLLKGARLVMAEPGGHRDPAYLASLIQAEAITTVHFVPSMLDLFLQEPAAAECTSLRQVICSGEALPERTVAAFHATCPAELHNLYGPTEAAIDVTAWHCRPQAPAGPIPIGRPIWNTRTYVLDAALRPLPVGATGELWLAGANLARGYVGREDLTGERFVTDPLHAEWVRETGTAAGLTQARMYRTGDLARWRPDGALDYVGRIDDQVKLRGQRIELGEVEATLARHPWVAGAAATVDRSGPADRLVAHVVLAAGAPAGDRPASDELASEALIAFAARSLPEAMVPSAVGVLDVLPLSPNGKLDRRALPVIAPAHAAAGPKSGGKADAPQARAAGSMLEQQLCEAFAEVLGVASFPPDARFFDAGGDSLLAARLAGTLRARLGIPLTLGALFTAQSPAALALQIDGGADLSALSPVLTLRAGGDQAPLFCIHPAGGISWCYAGLARTIQDRPIIGIQAPALQGNAMPPTLAGLAATYADLVEAAWPAGDCHLLGWSVGGVLAQAVGVELQRRGRATGLVALLDAYPGEQWAGQAPPSTEDALLALLFMGGLGADALDGKVATLPGVVAALAREGSALANLGSETTGRIADVVQACSGLMRAHRTEPLEGDLTFFEAAAPRHEDWLDPLRWTHHLSGELHLHRLDCTHPQMPRRGPLDEIGAQVARILSGGPMGTVVTH